MQTVATENTTLSSKGQLVIPKALRDQAQWAVGDRLSVVWADGEIRLRRVEPEQKSGELDAVIGCLKRPNQPRLTEAEIKRSIGERLKARLGV